MIGSGYAYGRQPTYPLGAESVDENRTILITPSRASQKSPEAKLICVEPSALVNPAKAEIELTKSEVTIGSGPRNSARLKDEGVSESHLIVFPGSGTWGIEDRGSEGGVIVNNEKITRTWLKSGDLVAIGSVKYRYRLVADLEKEDAEESTVFVKRSERRRAPNVERAKGSKSNAAEVKPQANANTNTKSSMSIVVAVILVVVAVAVAASVWFFR
jgi:pSer/pThr/pTyr-binding forkhead associated (FHA) protein